jgi:hypothetical protein
MKRGEIPMTRSQAVIMARDMYQETKDADAIAAKLEESGYVSKRTGKPLTRSGVVHMALYGKARKHRGTERTQSVQRTTTGTGRLALIKRILETKGLEANERIALAVLTIDAR